MSQENVEAVRAVYDEWKKGNFRAGVDLFDRRAMFIFHGAPDFDETGYAVGPEALAEYMRKWIEPWKRLTISAEEFIEAEASVMVVARQRGAGQESGLSVDLLQFQVWSFRGPKVIRLEGFLDRSEALEAVGLSE